MSEQDYDGFAWKGNQLRTIRELLDGATSCLTEQEADDFLSRYAKSVGSMSLARQNLGYIFGYCGDDTRRQLYRLFLDVSHPVFGPSFGRAGW